MRIARSPWRHFAGFLLLSVAAAAHAQQQAPAQAPPTPQQRVAMLKQWLAASQAQLRSYKWVETTVIKKGGEEKSRKVNTCFYGSDGKLQKVPAGEPAADSGGRGVRKRIAEKKKEEIADYMNSAVQLIHAYLPPDPDRIQRSVDAGKMSMSPQNGGRSVRLVFNDYLKAGDSLSVDIDAATNRLLGMKVASYLDDSAADAIQLDVAMGVLADGTIYTAKSTLAAPAKDLTVIVDNSGHGRASS